MTKLTLIWPIINNLIITIAKLLRKIILHITHYFRIATKLLNYLTDIRTIISLIRIRKMILIINRTHCIYKMLIVPSKLILIKNI